ncbi:hypothetical protein HMPREF1860_01293 [Prevotella amnii]|uniref:Preprotein translocase subunit SecB n=1 Tax=Prevotella amnii TaxID=419005 RepID=A0A134BCH4_9BACT|nr:hypothetical protein [Prevotella amnii]KXB77631.1 hypothetical protein HMPREF1860_01293 [Prevotella amnii]
MKENNEIEFGVLNLVEDAYIFNYDIDFANLDKEHLQIQFEHSINISAETETLIITMRVKILSGVNEIVKQGVRTSFTIKPFNSFINSVEDGGFNVTNPNLIDTFISVCIGALRGLLAKNLKGTPLNGFVLPLVPMSVIRRNSIKEKNKH